LGAFGGWQPIHNEFMRDRSGIVKKKIRLYSSCWLAKIVKIDNGIKGLYVLTGHFGGCNE
jgi:hypothetical protein